MSDSDDLPPNNEQNIHHKEREREFELAIGDEESIQRISDHIARYVGNPETVFHEIISDLVHVDVHVVKPRPERDFYTLVTSGMSDRAMTPQPDQAEYNYAELMICLPPDWPLDSEEHQWPSELLRYLARMPHEYETWFAEGHSVPNGDPPEAFPGTKMNAVLFVPPRTTPEEFCKLKVNDEKTIHFWAVIPLYPEELKLKLKMGTEMLYVKLNEHNVSELLDLNRPSTVKKLFGLF
jgi:Suppressor of fused protein (SUFU)